MKVKTRVSFKEYAKLLFKLTYSKPVMILILSVAALMLSWIITGGLKILFIPEPSIYQYITLLLIAVVQPLVIFRTIWNNYYSSNLLRETLEIETDFMEIHITGESFYMKLTWKNLYKVTELEQWFLLYQNNLSAIIIPKKSMSDKQVKQFKQLLSSIPNLDISLL